MSSMRRSIVDVLVLASVQVGVAGADSYDETIHIFKEAGKSGTFFDKSYGYALSPTIGGAGFIVGGAHRKVRVYVNGALTGDTTMNLLSAGFQAGANAYSEIIFFQNKRALDEFESGHFAFGADASAVAVSSGRSAGRDQRREFRRQCRFLERRHERGLLPRDGGIYRD